ncbi:MULTISPECIES: magnesium/cobalt transporter CorA [Bacillaceae]|uniref:magnesium/cobalt transporter CorA n=1 Tax=Bacillaceae TaxID=186817 RepID=UPI0029648B17|nr:magnesium/cobalt transporter CorA [Bacillus infantis]MDW2878616.1 magnesium/cobalt transporter CorA [Bacillus infantis]
MIRTIAVTKNHEIKSNWDITRLLEEDILWYWADFSNPSDAEIELLRKPLNFHPLAIEDCIHVLQRPKLDYYEDYAFFVTHSVNPDTIDREEVNFFLGKNYVITFHHHPSTEIEDVRERLRLSNSPDKWEPLLVLYHILDKIVDNYFPLVYQLEDTLNDIDENSKDRPMELLLEDLFDARHDLLALRHTVAPMRDLIYRMLNSQRLAGFQEKIKYFSDIHDHLLKLAEMIEENRELTTDIRDSYLSLNAHQTNRVMKVLTVITTIFMPLTFIAGIYGMNFEHMPELEWDSGYFATLLVMLTIGLAMFAWFKKKGWFK